MILAFTLAVLLGGVVLLLRRRRARQRNLSGTESDRPIFGVEPPRRRMSPRRRERL